MAQSMIQILYFDGCPNHEPTVDLTRAVVGELGIEAEIREIRVETPEAATQYRFLGSPTVRVNGEDIDPEARARTDFALSCRMYKGTGIPSKDLLVAALRKVT